MEVKVREEQDVHVVSVAGQLDLLTSGDFFSGTAELRRKPGAKIVLDLCALTYVDSTGLGQLWKTVESARAEGGKAVLAGVPPFVRKTLDLVGLSKEVVIVDSVEEAVRSLMK